MKLVVDESVKCWFGYMKFRKGLRTTLRDVLLNGPTMMKADEAIIDFQESIRSVAELMKTKVDKKSETRSRRQ